MDDDAAVFRFNPATVLVFVLALLCAAAAQFGYGLARLLAGEGVVAAVFWLLAVLTVVMAWRVCGTDFSIRVDAHGLRFVGLLGVWRREMAWRDIAAVGLARPSTTDGNGASSPPRPSMLTLRPQPPLEGKPRWAKEWDEDTGLLYITSPEGWYGPTEGLESAVRRFAGDQWVDRLDAGA
jgi:hypothetical protein